MIITALGKHSLKWDSKFLNTKKYVCGICGQALVSQHGWQCETSHNPARIAAIYICHYCTRPTFFDYDGQQVPGSIFGDTVTGITDDSVRTIYEEARRAMSASCYTAAVLCCRKLLMHIAVSKGASPGESFAYYVDFLGSKNYVPPDAKGWVDHIRKKGNEANHEIVIITREDAEELIRFSSMLLKIIFEFPATVNAKYGCKPS